MSEFIIDEIEQGKIYDMTTGQLVGVWDVFDGGDFAKSSISPQEMEVSWDPVQRFRYGVWELGNE